MPSSWPASTWATVPDDPRLLVAAHVRAWEVYGYDGFHVTCDNWILPSALGCPIQFFSDQPPTGGTPILVQSKNLNLLTRPKTGTEGRMGFKVQATRLAAQAVGDRCFLKTCFDQGPFSLASAVRGIETLMLDCTDDPQFVVDLLEICTEAVIKFARACGQAGCHALTFGEATAGLLSRRLYQQFAFPYQQRSGCRAGRPGDSGLHAHLRRYEPYHRPHGRHRAPRAWRSITNMIWPYYRQRTGGAVASKATSTLPASCSEVRPNKSAMRSGWPSNKGKPGCRFILSGGCEIPRDTPGDNLRNGRGGPGLWPL